VQVRFHPHALDRLRERGAEEAEVIATVVGGEAFPARYGRTGFRRNFQFDSVWRGRRCTTKQVETFAIEEAEGWLVITVIVKYF